MDAAAGAFVSLNRAAMVIVTGDAPWPPYAEFDAETFSAGTPLLAGLISKDFEQLFLESAVVMLPVIRTGFPLAAKFAVALNATLEDTPGLAFQLVAAVLSGDEKVLDAAAEQLDIPTPALSFLVQEIIKPCLRRAAKQLGKLADNELWFKSHCPVCGSHPDMGYLKEKGDPSEYLVSKAGMLWLHCSMCGHAWRFMRLVCPACGQEDHERQEVLASKERPEERLHVCLDCKHYLPVADLTKWHGPFDPDLAPLGLIHLDILAREKGYSPLVQRPWNSFG
jgi:FdhE protein